MSYWVKSVVGAAIFLAALALFNVELLKLFDTGTCASGGPYVSARPCPDGTTTNVLLLMGSILGGLIGAFIFAARGARPGDPNQGKGAGLTTGMLCWALFFSVTGAVSVYYGVTADDPGPGAQTAAFIVGGTFLLMGLPVLVWLVYLGLSRRRDPAPDPRFQPSVGTVTARPARAYTAPVAPAPAPTPAQQGADTVTQLERLQRLRESGALTDAEFEQQKRRLLGG